MKRIHYFGIRYIFRTTYVSNYFYLKKKSFVETSSSKTMIGEIIVFLVESSSASKISLSVEWGVVR